MFNTKKLVAGGLALAGLAIAGYRAYELNKLRKELEEEQIIEVQPEKVETVEPSRK